MSTSHFVSGWIVLIIGLALLITAIVIIFDNQRKGVRDEWYIYLLLVLGIIGVLIGFFLLWRGRRISENGSMTQRTIFRQSTTTVPFSAPGEFEVIPPTQSTLSRTIEVR